MNGMTPDEILDLMAQGKVDEQSEEFKESRRIRELLEVRLDKDEASCRAASRALLRAANPDRIRLLAELEDYGIIHVGDLVNTKWIESRSVLDAHIAELSLAEMVATSEACEEYEGYFVKITNRGRALLNAARYLSF